MRVASLGLFASLAACAGEGTGPEAVASVLVSPGTATVASRAPLPLSASARTAGGKTLSNRPITWSSADTAIAKVSATGLVTAGVVVQGAARNVLITATSDGVSGIADLTVLPAPVATVAATAPTMSIAVGATLQLGVELRDAAALLLSGRAIIWTSSDPSVATVDAAGLVTSSPYTGGGARTTIITASSEGQNGSATITVQPLPVTQLTVVPDSVAVGDTQLLTATLLGPSGAALSGRTIQWTSSDTTVATISPAGLAIPVQRWDGVVRTVTVTATSEGVSGAGTLTVLPAPVGYVAITPSAGALASGAIDTLEGTARSLSGVLLPGRAISWQSSDPAILAIDVQGVLTAGIVRGATAVAVTITATADGVSSTATFSVLPSPVASVTVTPDSVALYPLTTSQIASSAADAGANALTGRTTIWVSLAPAIANVSNTGLITVPAYTGLDTLVTSVIATIEGIADTVTVVVLPDAVLSVDLVPSTIIMPVGTSQRIHSVLRNAVGGILAARSVSWSSSDPSIASVTDSGVVTRHLPGDVTIIANSEGTIATAGVATLAVALDPASFVGGGYHHCALSAAGAAWCWGWNGFGQLGNGTIVESTSPVPVSGGHVFQQLSAGGMHTCGLTTGGVTFCWGWNTNGQIGDNTTNHRSTPVPVLGGLTFASIAAGWYHACGLTAAGEAHCWGRNNVGQLGNDVGPDRHVPGPIAPGFNFTMLITKYSHTCGLTAAGAAFCWGRNVWGGLGDGTLVDRAVPTSMAGGHVFDRLAVGWDHTCGITAADETWCAGRNQYGQVGDGTFVNRSLLTRITGAPPLRSMGSGYYHMCAIAIDDRGICWGRNHTGELGDGTLIDRNAPLVVEPMERFVAIAGTYSHSCGMVETGIIHCWGTLAGGVLGDAPPPAGAFLLPRRSAALLPDRRSGPGRRTVSSLLP